VLVVEDEPLVGLDLIDMLRAAGADVVSTKRARDAISNLDWLRITAAVLDINLGDHDCSAVCEHLWKRGIPFFFYTGYNDTLADWHGIPVIQKPARPEVILEAVERLCNSRPQVA
jgi:DNA-binding response OmpR family regulator